MDAGTSLPSDRLRTMRSEALADLRAMVGQLEPGPEASAERAARGRTARALVVDAVTWASRPNAEPADRAELIAELNLLYDVSLVAAEYYKLFVREPTRERPAGRI